MNLTKHVLLVAAVALILAARAETAYAQETPPPADATPAATPTPTPENQTLMDRQYDGRLHITAAPYVWAPTVKANFHYTIPTLPHAPVGGAVVQSGINIGPSDYLPKVNSVLMLAFDAHKGDGSLFGDVIYLNASTSATFAGSVSGPLGKIRIPFTINTDARVATAIWEVAAGFALAHGHNADLSFFTGVRQFPTTLTLGYDAVIGKRGIIAPSGTVKASDHVDDVIFGLRGKAFLGDDRWFVPYYVDYGTGMNNQSWQAYGGAGYAFRHGQSLILVYRNLDYSGFPQTTHVQKFSMGGPLLGYTFAL